MNLRNAITFLNISLAFFAVGGVRIINKYLGKTNCIVAASKGRGSAVLNDIATPLDRAAPAGRASQAQAYKEHEKKNKHNKD